MQKYASTFISGFSDLVAEELPKMVPDAHIKKVLDGLIVYTSHSPWEVIKRIPIFNNSFVVISETQQIDLSPLIHLKRSSALVNLNHKFKTFRIVASKENQAIEINTRIRSKIEESIKSITHLEVDRTKPATEFWFLLRNEGFGFFGLRITKHQDYKKTLPQGELRPELAYLMCLLSDPKDGEVFMDPFCGHGAIPQQRLNFGYEKIIANDLNIETVEFLKQRFRSTKNIDITNFDALQLTTFQAGSIDKIVTDPPWGFFENNDADFNKFYFDMLAETHRVLVSGGILVVLTARKEEFQKALTSFGKFKLVESYNILVNGKKAGVYKLLKV